MRSLFENSSLVRRDGKALALAALVAATLATVLAPAATGPAMAQEQLPWRGSGGANDSYRPPSGYGDNSVYRPVQSAPAEVDSSSGGASPGSDGVYRPRGNGSSDAYSPPPDADRNYRDGGRAYDAPRSSGPQYGEPYAPPRQDMRERYDDEPAPRRGTYSEGEIMRAGHGFFGSVSKGLASAVEYVFQKAGRPNGYILGEDAGGALVAGLRYGEGRLFTKDAGEHPVYWQGPTLGYDFGAEGSKTMVLVYNLRDPSEIYNRFGGVQGSAYLIGGVGVQFQKYGDVVLAPIRSGVGLRLGANVGYLKYTRKPTWNPF